MTSELDSTAVATVERIREHVRARLAESLFEPDTEHTQQQLLATINSHLYTEWRAGNLHGDTPENAYYVQFDLVSTEGEPEDWVVRYGVAVARPAVFLTAQLSRNNDTAAPEPVDEDSVSG